jgi:hypothetical protein
VPLKTWHPVWFFQRERPILLRAGGQGRAGGPTHSGKHTVPISNRVFTRFSKTGQRPFVRGHARSAAKWHTGRHSNGQARLCDHLSQDDKLRGLERGLDPLSKSDVTHLYAGFGFCPKRVGQSCISPSVKLRTATI